MEIDTSRLKAADMPELPRNLASFWLMGLINNSAYVVMIAGANSISSASVGLVYMAAVFPGMLIKLTGPFWFHHVSYVQRSIAIAVLMTVSYTIVALNSLRVWQLFGVVFASIQGGLGEATVLSLTSYYKSDAAITAWSSGTGFAGIFGYAWVALLHVFGGFSFKATLLAANITSIGWLAVWFVLLEPIKHRMQRMHLLQATVRSGDFAAAVDEFNQEEESGGGISYNDVDDHQAAGYSMYLDNVFKPTLNGSDNERRRLLKSNSSNDIVLESTSSRLNSSSSSSNLHRCGGGLFSSLPASQQLPHSLSAGNAYSSNATTTKMSTSERLKRMLSLWPYTVPLFLVYFAEYVLQAGVWPSIGFPLDNAAARHDFYVYANFQYQIGVFLSRSSGLMYRATVPMLWLMPCLQVGFLFFFLFVALYQFMYNWSLLLPAFCTGLLGGACYVNAFNLIASQVKPEYKEFSLGAASLSDSLGILCADFVSIFLQGCLFKANGIKGADYRC